MTETKTKTETPISIKVFGRLSFTGLKAKLPHKAKLLLAYLAVEGEPVSREWLAAALWGRQSREQQRHSLRNALLESRRAGFHIGGFSTCILEDPKPRCDWDKLKVTTKKEELLGIAHLYKGPFLQEITTDSEDIEEWIMARREMSQIKIVEVLTLLASSSTPHEAVCAGIQCMEIDPLSERGCRGLMRAYARIGEPIHAHEAYIRLSVALRRELGNDIVPSATTTELLRRIKAEAEIVDPEEITFRVPCTLDESVATY